MNDIRNYVTNEAREDIIKQDVTIHKVHSGGNCKHCDKYYQSYGWLKKHESKCTLIIKKEKQKEKQTEEVMGLKQYNTPTKKLKIAPHIRFQVWDKWVGNKITTKCFCCDIEYITPFTNYKTFHSGHIISEFNGGKICIENLLPICCDCNRAMGTMNWDEYTDMNNLPVRIYGN